MKTLKVHLIQIQNPVVPDQPSTLKVISLALLGVDKARLIPSVGDYSAVSWNTKWLKKVSDTLNVRT